RAEQRHEAVAEKLVDRALVTVHLGERGLEEGVDQNVHALGAEPLGEARGADEVAEEHGDGLTLALQRTTRGEDPVGEVPRRVGRGRAGLRLGGPRCARRGGARRPHWPPALQAELRALGERGTAREAGRREPPSALETELRLDGVLLAAVRAAHREGSERPRSGDRYKEVTSWQNCPTRYGSWNVPARARSTSSAAAWE